MLTFTIQTIVSPKKMKQQLHILFVTFLLAVSLILPAQKNLSYHLNSNYQRGLELFQKQKYNAAQQFFKQVLQDTKQERSIEKTNAEYYITLCAINLTNDDAEMLLEKFLMNNPESNLKSSACFEMAKYQYDKKNYSKAIRYFEMVEKHNLTKDEQFEYYFKSGYSYFSTNNLDKARISFFEIKDIDNKYASPAIYYYSHIAYTQKNYETALQGFNRLVKDETFAPIVPYYIAQCYYFQKKYDDLLTFAVPMIDSVIKSRMGEMSKLVADAYYFKNQFSEALPFFERYVKNSPGLSANDNYQIGFCYYKARKYETAIKYLELASIGESITAQNALYHLADCYIHTNNKKMARVAFEGASRFDFDARIKEDALFNSAVVTYEIFSSPFNEAIKAFSEYIALYPTSERSDEAYNYLTLAYLNTHNYKDALAYIEKIKIKDNSIRKAYQRIAYFRALELINDQRYQEAIPLLNTSLQNGEFNPQIKASSYYWIGESNYRMNATEEALDNYNMFLNLPASAGTPEYNIVHYNIGYLYFNQKKYTESAGWFSKYLALVKDAKVDLTADAYNRLGDCMFEKTQYTEAIDAYTKSIVIGKSNKDYAIFQKGFTLGIQGKYEQKISYLNQLCTEFPASPFVDDAIYEIGNSNLILQRNDNAISYFKKVVNDYPTSTYVKKALRQLGLIYYNQDKNKEALAAYKKLIADYPGTPEAKSVLLGIKNIYVEMNDVDAFIAYTDSLGPTANISMAEQDSLSYSAGENVYMQGNCEKALENFNKYIQKFPEGSFIINTRFYKAECLNRSKDTIGALEGYNFVLSKPRNNFTESALIAAGRINMFNKRYRAAIDNYVKLEELAELPNNIQEARLNLVNAYYAIQEYSNVIAVAKRLLPSEKLSPEDSRRTRYMLAKSYLATNSIVLAEDEFRKLSKEVKSPEGAEAKYMVAEILFNQQDYAKTETEIFNFIDQNTPQQYWIARSFLLLSDVYVKKKDDFQASQTLQSIIENYDNKTDDILHMAKEKLDAIQHAAIPVQKADSTAPEIQVK